MTRILVFNHSPNILRLFNEVLTKKGFEVIARLEEVTTISQVEGIDPDIIILGYLRGLPDGESDIVLELQAHPTLGKIPLIIATTSVLQMQQQTPIGAIQGISYLDKPFDIDALMRVVNEAVAMSGAELPYPPSNPLSSGSTASISKDAINSDLPINL